MIMPGVTSTKAKAMDKAAAEQRPGSSNNESVEMDDAEGEVDDLNENKPKKKRRIIKMTDKKYECPTPDCGKSYSRAEHLYRHQLNHTPKHIYRCDFPGCDRHFVRADLCARHKERHTAKGSHLQRKDAFMTSQRAAVANSNVPTSDSASKAVASTSIVSPVDSAHPQQQQQSGPQSAPYLPPPARGYRPDGEPYRDQPHTPSLPPLQAEPGVDAQLHGAPYSAYPTRYSGPGHVMPPPASPASTRRYSMDGQYERPTSMQDGYPQMQQQSQLPLHPPPMSSAAQGGPIYAQPSYPPPSAVPGQGLQSPMNGGFTTLPALPAFQLPQSYSGPSDPRPGMAMSPPAMGGASQYDIPSSRIGSLGDFNMLEQFSSNYAMPVFGGDGFNRSPQAPMDDLYLQQLLATSDIDMTNMPSPSSMEMSYHSQVPGMPLPKYEPQAVVDEQASKPENWEENTSPSINGMDLSMRECVVTERKQARILAMVKSFDDVENFPGRKCKDDMLAGDTSDDKHPLSVNMLKTYVTSYWLHIHQQMPIMHRPTFNPETCPDLLLLTMCCLGACCLERTHAAELIRNCAELAFFCAHHIRWEVFKDAEFRPTAKLWTFQTMLLLELFEKMYSTRELHERAHIHHATTLTVMRRGSSLIGRSVIETPSGSGAAAAITGQDPTRTPPGPDGSINTSGVNTPDAWWNRWITAEATRRVAFAAFIIDSTHATLFGHAAVMSPHDIRLPLPCDEYLWSATSSAEVQRVEASLAANGFKPTSFIEGLRKYIAGQKVRTNVFGRVILMAGLLNVSWQMNQRDLQVSSLGAANTLGSSTRWRSSLRNAFDHWRKEFDESLGKNEYLQVSQSENKSRCHKDHRDNVFESRTCLHSLAHMAMHVDIVDCEVFAGSDRALGRAVTDADRAAVQRRMREQWAPSARARDATFWALRFLCELLLPAPERDEEGNVKQNGIPPPPRFTYSARDDYLLNRPWILYFAVMIVWSYGYALDGPITASHNPLNSRDSQILDLHHYLTRIGGVKDPGDLESLRDRNSCLGLLILLRECFSQPRWELLHEAGDMLQLCIGQLLPNGHSETEA
ncbi:hypothetical protein DOTSEDRAFT_75761 [Dothistroma septosporum NZE10]|uniref:C2H2-type domain-containing protein n=1 Tax=Dothistroma septosporum (strain NZE10 / CBS 128990) TaxID=675120 RepID=N1PDM6_DOTSN|nr:hypothetical protein DOTSEDRAFT_75761 [Dothistroma septosporum NZE10]